MKVLAIDPGFGRCGVAVLLGSAAKSDLLYSACIETDSKTPFSGRLQLVGKEIERIINEFKPETVALEELYFTNNAKTALHVAEVRGMIMYITESHGLPLVEYNPLAVKIALTGYGRASKAQVTAMVQKLIKLPAKQMLDDEYDAIAVGLTALAHEKSERVLRES